MTTSSVEPGDTANTSRPDPTNKPPDAAMPPGPQLSTLRPAISEVFARAVGALPHWNERAEAARSDWRTFVALEFDAWADYLVRWQTSGDVTFRSLLMGEHVKALHDSNADSDLRRKSAAELGATVRAGLQALLGARAPTRLDEDLAAMYAVLAAEPRRERRVLLVGDCLFLDIVGFVIGQAVADGIGLVTEYATSKKPALLKAELRRFADERIDLVFYSPYTYEFAGDYARLADWRESITDSGRIEAVADEAAARTDSVLAALAVSFECPVYVHNSSALVREEADWKRALKLAVTRRTRSIARHRVNAALAASIDRHNRSTFRHLFPIDEAAVVRRAGEFRAGAYLHQSALQHPAELGRLMAEPYSDLLFVDAFLVNRKVVVCDLDNTVWDGVIGEGGVIHHHDRQAVLKRLRERGIVLAVNSKNDPANVHWTGGTLQADDFVFSAVSWSPKVQGMRRIQQALNLKTKDYVFVDDREDERALMQEAFADVACLDATQGATWRRLALWCERLDEEVEMDRTAMYRQRDLRDAFVKDAGDEQDAADMFGKLGLSVEIFRAGASDLKRVTELINRTSQFNLEGSRVTFPQVRAWHDDPSKHAIFLGRTADRFGTMGVTCICVVGIGDGVMTLLPFVLSCRVFGYGIETAVMNHLKRLAREAGVTRIVGRYVSTPQNGPCKNFLPLSGFVPLGDRWELTLSDSGAESNPDPLWLRVVATTSGALR